MRDPDLDRLLRAAAEAPDSPAEMPYGFDTRVVASARSGLRETGSAAWDAAWLFRRVVYAAVVVTLFASSAAYWEMSENTEAGESLMDSYEIADNAVTTEFLP